MDIILYNNSAEKIRVDKTEYLNSENNYTSIPISELPEGSEIAGNPDKPEIA